tara:strand:+ start:72421 stop:72711 length:291 start_codon:yes stop_codon:yes gene_type:complete
LVCLFYISKSENREEATNEEFLWKSESSQNKSRKTLRVSLIPKKNTPVTKGELKNLENRFLRFYKIKNLKPQKNGALLYFDMQKNLVVYSLRNPNI